MNLIPSKIKLMADYDSWCLWDLDNAGNIDPNSLPLTEALKEALRAWESKYDATLNRADPIESGFISAYEAQKFNAEGWELWERLKQRLKKTEVVYFDNELSKVLDAKPSTSSVTETIPS